MSCESASRDLDIEQAVRSKICAGSIGARVDVRVFQGKVYLLGTLPSLKDKLSAERAVRNLAGIKCVINQVRIIPNADLTMAWQFPLASTGLDENGAWETGRELTASAA